MIRILSAEQIREADQFTIQHDNISSIDLTENAASAFHSAFLRLHTGMVLYIFCGNGNNGGDGLAFACIMSEYDFHIKVFTLAAENYSEDFLTNRKKLSRLKNVRVRDIKRVKDFPVIEPLSAPGFDDPEINPVIIDALFGSGLNRPIEGLAAELINYLNQQNFQRIALDIPSGLYADKNSDGICFHAQHTITLQQPKLSFLFAENYAAVGEWQTVDIGLNKDFIASLPSSYFITEEEDIEKILRRRNKFDHKGNFGHAFIHAGNAGKMGASILCAKACASTGAGLTTVHIPSNQSVSLNASVPEAMTEEYEKASVALKLDLGKYTAFAFGPGIGTSNSSKKTFFALLKQLKSPAVFDADALNILSEEKKPFKLIPKNSILTPHPKEFERLAVKTNNWHERFLLQLSLSKAFSLYIILKGAYTCTTTPDGKAFFNTTGNPGMAKGGSGDVLTGMIVSLLAQKYSAEEACIAAVYLHGLAGDLAVRTSSPYSMLASDIINNIAGAMQSFGG